MVEHETSIVDAVHADLHTHVFDHDATAWLHLIVTDAHNEGVNTLILAGNMSLSEHDGIVGVAGAIGNPELLAKYSRRVNNKFLFNLVVDGRGLHLWRVVAIAELCEAEAAHVLERAYIAHEGQVTL